VVFFKAVSRMLEQCLGVCNCNLRRVGSELLGKSKGRGKDFFTRRENLMVKALDVGRVGFKGLPCKKKRIGSRVSDETGEDVGRCC
jgi:hypothetical protein